MGLDIKILKINQLLVTCCQLPETAKGGVLVNSAPISRLANWVGAM
jgi:hypothetical protein